jgi:hypothetical protein
MIEHDINEKDVFGIFAQAYTLGCKKMQSELVDHIIKKFLNTKTCLSYMIFADRFHNVELAEACKKQLHSIFAWNHIVHANKAIMTEDKPSKEEEEAKASRKKEVLTALPYLSATKLVEILRMDELEIEHEHELVDVVNHYLVMREEMTKN